MGAKAEENEFRLALSLFSCFSSATRNKRKLFFAPFLRLLFSTFPSSSVRRRCDDEFHFMFSQNQPNEIFPSDTFSASPLTSSIQPASHQVVNKEIIPRCVKCHFLSAPALLHHRISLSRFLLFNIKYPPCVVCVAVCKQGEQTSTHQPQHCSI